MTGKISGRVSTEMCQSNRSYQGLSDSSFVSSNCIVIGSVPHIGSVHHKTKNDKVPPTEKGMVFLKPSFGKYPKLPQVKQRDVTYFKELELSYPTISSPQRNLTEYCQKLKPVKPLYKRRRRVNIMPKRSKQAFEGE